MTCKSFFFALSYIERNKQAYKNMDMKSDDGNILQNTIIAKCASLQASSHLFLLMYEKEDSPNKKEHRVKDPNGKIEQQTNSSCLY